MANFSLSPAVLVKEAAFDTIIPAVSVSIGGFAGDFAWGPQEEVVTVSDENQLVEIFHKPNDSNFKDWLSASSFLAYARNLKIVRASAEGSTNAVATLDSTADTEQVKNLLDYQNSTFGNGTSIFIARYPGALGNSIGVAWADTAGYNDVDSNGPTWTWKSLFSTAPGSNRYHIVVYDATGDISGEVGTVLERFVNVSTVAGTMSFDGTSAYYKEVLERSSRWIWAGNTSLLTGTNDGLTMTNGADGDPISDGERQAAWALFQDAEGVDVNLIFAGGANATSSKWIIDNVAEYRKDCVAFVSPSASDVVGIASISTIKTNIRNTRTVYGSSSYAVMDSNYKYMYDRYNDVYRWVPLNGDIAGIHARTADENDPWYPAGGYRRGRIKNATRFAFNQDKATRDELYSNDINPCFVDSNDGPIFLGNRTLYTTPNGFSRINIRMLFIVLEKAIATASKYMLFEFNDEFTRADFVNMTDPYLRDIQGRRGIIRYRIICDETNNTDDVVNNFEFVGTFRIQASRGIEVITLNFISDRVNSVSFEEVVEYNYEM